MFTRISSNYVLNKNVINKKPENKIAILGTSPVMVILALELVKKNSVTIYEKSKNLGGAWSLLNFKNKNIKSKTNVVVPLNQQQEQFISKLNKFLKKKVNIKKIYDKYSTLSSFKPKKIYDHSFINLYKELLKSKIKIIKKEVTAIKANEHIFINNKDKFSKAFIPFYSSIKKIYNNKFTIKTNYKIIKSKHFMVILKDKFLKDFYYSENFNKVFDRAQLNNYGNFFVFNSRIRKPFKNFNKKKLMRTLSQDLKHHKVLLTKKITYENFYRDSTQIKILMSCNKFKNIKIIDTSNFVGSLQKLRII